jgi:hypothetical protein
VGVQTFCQTFANRVLAAACQCACLQYLVQQAAQRVFLVVEGGLKLLEGGVADYVKQVGSSGKKKSGASSAKVSGGTAAPAKSSQKQPVARKR